MIESSFPTPAEGRFPGGLTLSDEPAAIQRLSALQALDVARRAVMGQ